MSQTLDISIYLFCWIMLIQLKISKVYTIKFGFEKLSLYQKLSIFLLKKERLRLYLSGFSALFVNKRSLLVFPRRKTIVQQSELIADLTKSLFRPTVGSQIGSILQSSNGIKLSKFSKNMLQQFLFLLFYTGFVHFYLICK